MIDLSIVIVNWKVGNLVMRLLDSIYKFTNGINFEVFVIDNNSEDNSIQMVREKFPQVHLIANKENLGFAKACNQGMKESGGEFVLLLNPDTEIFDNALERLVLWMRSRPEIGIGGVKLLNSDRTLQASVRRFPTFWSQAFILFKLHHLLPRLNQFHCYFARDFDYSREQEVDQVMGAFFCIRRKLIEKIGLLDENFFIWFEEVDFCKRAKDVGFKVVYLPEISVIHYGGESFAQVFAFRKQKMFNNSLAIYLRKHNSFLAWLGIKLLSPFSLLLAWFVQIIRL